MLTLTGKALQGLGDRFAELQADDERGAIVSTEAAGILAVVVAVVVALLAAAEGFGTDIAANITNQIQELFGAEGAQGSAMGGAQGGE